MARIGTIFSLILGGYLTDHLGFTSTVVLFRCAVRTVPRQRSFFFVHQCGSVDSSAV